MIQSMSFNRLSPEEIVNKVYADPRVEYLALIQSFRVFYYRVFFRSNGRMPRITAAEESMLKFFQDMGDLTFKRENKDITYLIQNTPQGSGKTTKIAYFIAWSILREPRSNFLVVSAVDRLSAPLVQNVHNLLFRADNSSALTYIQEICNIKKYRFSDGNLEINSTLDISHKDGKIRAMGIGSQITGFSANVADLEHFSGCVIIDDPSDASTNEAQIANEAISVLHAAGGRLRNHETGYIFANNQRLGANDITGIIKERYKEISKSLVIPLHTRFNTSSIPAQKSKEQLIQLRNKAREGVNPQQYYFNCQQMDTMPIETYTTENMIERAQIGTDFSFMKRQSFKQKMQEVEERGLFTAKLYSIDTSSLKKNSDPTGVAEFMLIGEVVNGAYIIKCYLLNMFFFKYETFAERDRAKKIEPRPHYQGEFENILDFMIRSDVLQGRRVYVLVEGTVQSAALIGGLGYKYRDETKVEILEQNHKHNKSDGSAKYGRFETAMNWHGRDLETPRFFIVRKSDDDIHYMKSTNPTLYPHMGEVIEKYGRQSGLAGILKEQLRTINSRKTHDEFIDCVSQALNYAETKELNLMQKEVSSVSPY